MLRTLICQSAVRDGNESMRRPSSVVRQLARRPQLGAERLERRAMFNADDGSLGDTTPSPVGSGPVFNGPINGNVYVAPQPGVNGPVFRGEINGDVYVGPMSPPSGGPFISPAPTPGTPTFPSNPSWRDIDIPVGWGGSVSVGTVWDNFMFCVGQAVKHDPECRWLNVLN